GGSRAASMSPPECARRVKGNARASERLPDSRKFSGFSTEGWRLGTDGGHYFAVASGISAAQFPGTKCALHGGMQERSYESEPPYTRVVYAVAMLVVGLLAGYLLASPTSRTTSGAASPPAVTTQTTATLVVDETAVKTYRDILEREPKNLQAAVSAGDLLYDAHRYVEAIPYYQQAFALKPSDINVSTDL